MSKRDTFGFVSMYQRLSKYIFGLRPSLQPNLQKCEDGFNSASCTSVPLIR